MKTHTLTIHLPDTRGVVISRYGKGNAKLGSSVYTYSRMPGRPNDVAIGHPLSGHYTKTESVPDQIQGTCPGATDACLAVCYAARVVEDDEPSVVDIMWERNTYEFLNVPPIPEDCRLLRLHIGGDFSTVAYIEKWIARITERPDVTCWAYTRSWRVPALLPALERLRALPNMQLFASMDAGTPELPPAEWRRAWIETDEERLIWKIGRPVIRSTQHNGVTSDGTPAYVCPEQTGRKASCETCAYCFLGRKHDVVFMEH